MTFRLAWSTDIHLNFLDTEGIRQFCKGIRDIDTDSLVISGDIAEGPSFLSYLELLDRELELPIFFVLGNHDYYRSSIKKVRALAADLTKRSERLKWLPEVGVVEIAPSIGLLGHDGWADGRLGDYRGSKVVLNDYLLIHELSDLTSSELFAKLNELGDEAASYIRQHLPAAMEMYSHVYVVTHVPPFMEACWHRGMVSSDDWLPHFSSGVMGDVLREVASAHPFCDLTVLCGHTHSRGVVKIASNLVVRTGGAVYGAPVIEELIDIGTAEFEAEILNR